MADWDTLTDAEKMATTIDRMRTRPDAPALAAQQLTVHDLLPSLLAKVDADALIAEAIAEHKPVAAFCLFSGGYDSGVLAHRCREHYSSLMHIDTGTAVPGVREYVQLFADWVGKPLIVYEAGDAFRQLVLTNGGFPGPAGHGRAYTRLKERQIEALVRDAKVGHRRADRVMMLTGKRRAESARRTKTTAGIGRKKAQVYVNPLIDWTAEDMRAYRAEHALPENPVAALLHRSGECNCGAFASPGEREMLQSLWPEWFGWIEELEAEAQALGISACKWGQRPPRAAPADVAAGPLCSTCEWRQEELDV